MSHEITQEQLRKLEEAHGVLEELKEVVEEPYNREEGEWEEPAYYYKKIQDLEGAMDVLQEAQNGDYDLEGVTL